MHLLFKKKQHRKNGCRKIIVGLIFRGGDVRLGG